MKIRKEKWTLWIMLAVILLAACSGDDTGETTVVPDIPVSDAEIRLEANAWQMMAGTRTTYYDTQGDLRSNGFKCYAYIKDSSPLVAYINGLDITWSGSAWMFPDGKHYWPASEHLHFFAYLPSSVPSYIQNITFTTANQCPQFDCQNLPVTSDGQGSSLKEFVYAFLRDQNKTDNGASGVNLAFHHPFARIKFVNGKPDNIKIQTITFKNIKNNGTFNYDTNPKWTTSGSATNFVANINQSSYAGSSTPIAIGDPYIVLPQTFTGDIEVVAKWTDWGEDINHTVTATVPMTWQPGYTYTYTFNIINGDLVVNSEKYTEQW